MMAKKYFGTDGVRGEVGQFPITPDFVLKLGYAAGQVLVQHDTDQNRPSSSAKTRAFQAICWKPRW